MKKIYTISLDDEIPLSDELLNEIKMLCFLVYDSIKILEYDEIEPILNYDGIIYNELLESYSNGCFHYRFTYDNYESGKYEPFMIDNKSFGFTVNDSKLDDEELVKILDENKKMLNMKYNFKVNAYVYKDDKKHKNRLITLKRILMDKLNKENRKDKHIRSLKPIASALATFVR